jgi:thioredoxin-disulfide reductase
MYDVIIIGAGPAGFTAAIYAARREMKTLIIAKEPGGQIMWASEIENYPGFISIDNFDLISKMQEHVKANNVEIKTKEVSEIRKIKKGGFEIVADGEKIQTKTVIIAMGLTPRKLNVPGEQKFLGKGVTYCANCDGPFYRDKVVAVVGGGNAALDAAEIMSKIAKKVYLVHRRQEFKAFEVLVKEVKSKKNIELVLDSAVSGVVGKENVDSIDVKNVTTNEVRNIELDGVFIEIGRVAQTEIVKDLVKRDKKNQIIIDDYCRTNLSGLFAAGDVTTVPFKQISIATGQATIAALSAYQFLQIGDWR